jgi:hypothetical protein
MEEYNKIIQAYKDLSWVERSLIKEIAVQTLLDQGATEIGTSDVNCSIVSLYNSCGNFSNIVEKSW